MSILFRDELFSAMHREAVEDRLIIQPLLDDAQVGPGSVDLRLGTEFFEIRRRSETIIDPLDTERDPQHLAGEPVYIPLGEHFVLHPGQFVLGSTFEFIRLPSDIGGQVLGRSSWGRLGLIVATAVVVQPGFAGVLTLELVNAGSVPFRLYPGLRVAQLQLWRASDAVSLPYSSGEEKYRAPLGPESPRLAWESDEMSRIKEIGKRLVGQ